MRQFVALLLPALAWADNSLPNDRPRAWREACAARLEQAQTLAMRLDGRFERGKVQAFVDEDVLPLREHAEYRLDLDGNYNWGFLVAIGPARAQAADSEWIAVTEAPNGRLMERKRTLSSRTADVRQKLDHLSKGQAQRLQALWEAAADDCLRMR